MTWSVRPQPSLTLRGTRRRLRSVARDIGVARTALELDLTVDEVAALCGYACQPVHLVHRAHVGLADAIVDGRLMRDHAGWSAPRTVPTLVWSALFGRRVFRVAGPSVIWSVPGGEA
jgi:hypothetical protein